MSSISHGLVLATAMVISSTVLYLSCRQRSFPPSHLSRNQNSQQPQKLILRSCLHSGEKKRERKKKKVQFAENVKEPSGNGEEYRKGQMQMKLSKFIEENCRNKIPTIGGMQENRTALYNGILKDRVRVQRMQCSC
ncbi:uncharacterized protein LOC115992081 [Quercus lobata]|uniref:Uncharacterized protein n=1 Tax=Quercus lobata TaxID=97700 RepID=A0A7N2LMW1_QUELO|nr:uncharacterized protein LOC115992081 [Quercus lobata]